MTDQKKETGDILSVIDETAKTVSNAIRRIRTSSAVGQFDAAARAAEAVKAEFDKLVRFHQEITKLHLALMESADRQFAELESSLRSELRPKNWKLDGSWPELYVERAIPVD